MKGFDALKGFLDGQRKRTPAGERRLGRRVPMRMPVRITTLDGLTWDGRVCDVNKRGLAIEPNQGIAKGEHLTAAFPPYEGVWPKFELKVVVRRLVSDPQPSPMSRSGWRSTVIEGPRRHRRHSARWCCIS
jgi:hypothetical protein